MSLWAFPNVYGRANKANTDRQQQTREVNGVRQNAAGGYDESNPHGLTVVLQAYLEGVGLQAFVTFGQVARMRGVDEMQVAEWCEQFEIRTYYYRNTLSRVAEGTKVLDREHPLIRFDDLPKLRACLYEPVPNIGPEATKVTHPRELARTPVGVDETFDVSQI